MNRIGMNKTCRTFVVLTSIVLGIDAGLMGTPQERTMDTVSGSAFPRVEEVQSYVRRMKDYVVRSTEYRIVDVTTGLEIRDFSTVNPNAGNDVSKNPYTNWDYPNGVFYSALVSATEVLKDTSYINYAIRNYNFIF